MKDTNETTEFFIPPWGLELSEYVGKNHKQGVHHLGRYHWAARCLGDVPEGRLLDVACGAGYGAYLLAKAMPDMQVVGADYDPRAVDHARTHYQAPNLSYRVADIVTWVDQESGEGLGDFDYITSFDTLEHLLHREIALVNFAENLRRGGTLLFSTPAKSENLLNPGWEHHKIEYAASYLYNLLRRFFGQVLVPDDGTLPHLNFWAEQINTDRMRYALRLNPVVCRRPLKLGMNTPRRAA